MCDTAELEKDNSKTKRLYWKGKIVSKQVYNQRFKQQTLAKNIWKKQSMKSKSQLQLSQAKPNLIEGRRIVHIDTVAKQMICKKCKSKLHFSDIVYEKQFGLASVFYMKCKKCDMICTVATDKQHATSKKKTL
ncbi:hypothetical protein PV325_007207 [Microctonus aethiopoides]|uniref:Mutator-like transposase domain-containing protein n=1 Tax=Microctonus aethiopoides TaxID=144406 RepID=A0AA39KQ83_9HYME|nr:hypothetical protein PV325_007207 [Microctonus aethiopoides]KAK0169749.1 hypothetical protein PV328_010391 [Microctonus aethiopoides]